MSAKVAPDGDSGSPRLSPLETQYQEAKASDDAKTVPNGREMDLSSVVKTKAKLRGVLSTAQIQVRTNKQYQTLVAAVTVFAVFCDILGTAMVMPALASLCSHAEGGPADTIANTVRAGFPSGCDASCEAVIESAQNEYISPYAFKGEKGAWKGAPPVAFSLSMNLINSVGMLGSAAGSVSSCSY